MKKMITLMFAGLALVTTALHAEIAVVVDPSVNLDNITVEQLERLYLNRPNRYPNGVRLTPVDQSSGSDIRKRFVEKVLWKTEVEVAKYWSRRMFSGKGHPPRQVNGDTEVIESVTGKPGTLGYIDGSAVDDRVKVLLSIP